jgi:penicillin-binding protein 1C
LLCALFWPLSDARIHRFYPLRFYSQENILLREFRTGNGSYGSALPLREFPPELIHAVLVAEDARFYSHVGFDTLAICRALFDNLRHLRVRSGASTITQQLARTIYAGELPQSRLLRKIFETVIALKLSATRSKNDVLEAYLNQVPMPLNSTGLPAAAERIFSKHISLLDNEELTALAVMISRRQFSRPSFEHGFRKLWRRLYPHETADFARVRDTLTHLNIQQSKSAPNSEHFVNWLRENELPESGDIHSEISANLNQAISAIVTREMPVIRQAGAQHAAVVVIELGEQENYDILRGMVGSADFGDEHSGELNHAVRVRSAGSTLKPFLYGLGFDKHIFTAQTMLSDTELTINTGSDNETYRPHNNDMRFWGSLTLRESLVASRNIPAITAIDRVGVAHFLELLHRAGFNHLRESAEFYGPGLAIGSGGATLMQLTHIYAALASHGKMRPVLLGRDNQRRALFFGASLHVLSDESASRITHMLSDRAMRQRAFGKNNYLNFPFKVAAKTGTSKDYRDGWIIGFTPKHVVGVWVGNSRNEPMHSVSGAWGAGRIFHQVMRHVTGDKRRQFSAARGLKEIRICRRTGNLARPDCPSHAELVSNSENMPVLCQLTHRGEKGDTPADSPVVVSPVQGERYILHPHEPAERQQIPVVIRRHGTEYYSYAINSESPRDIREDIRDFRQLPPGDHALRIFLGGEIHDEIHFSVR